MKKTLAVIAISFVTFACAGETEVIKQSLNNIKDEMVGMQSEMADMKLAIEDIDRKTEINRDNINANAGALAEIRSELSYIGSSVSSPRSAVTSPTPVMTPSTTTTSDSGVIIIEDSFSDKNSMYNYAYELYKNGKFEESRTKFSEFLTKYPSDELSDNALYWLGEIKYSEKDYAGAVDEFNRLLKTYPNGNKVPDGLIKMAYAYGSLGKKSESVAVLKKIINEYPGTRAYNLAKTRLAALGE
jgi:tol-pal system protein YbgF